MKQVFKQNLEVISTQTITLPKNAKILCVKEQYDKLVLYFEQDTEVSPHKEVKIIIVGTGHQLPELKLEFLDTVMVFGGQLVWHVYKEV